MLKKNQQKNPENQERKQNKIEIILCSDKTEIIKEWRNIFGDLKSVFFVEGYHLRPR